MVPIEQAEAKSRGNRRARGSVSPNRVGNYQVRYTDPYGKRRSAGTYRKKRDAEQALAVLGHDVGNTRLIGGLPPQAVCGRL